MGEKRAPHAVPFWRYNGTLPVSLSIKEVPDELAEALRKRARRNHRSLQGELMSILEAAVLEPGLPPERLFRAGALWKQVQQLELSTAPDAVKIVRRDRDSR